MPVGRWCLASRGRRGGPGELDTGPDPGDPASTQQGKPRSGTKGKLQCPPGAPPTLWSRPSKKDKISACFFTSVHLLNCFKTLFNGILQE